MVFFSMCKRQEDEKASRKSCVYDGALAIRRAIPQNACRASGDNGVEIHNRTHMFALSSRWFGNFVVMQRYLEFQDGRG
jgi:hypothetical protein